ncbi:hypothetical protein SAMN05443252_103243 [Bacillus sp. OV322]|nr:hypothetical protein SAMN05443252_103243 [Bacillus sp. OV322]
MNVQLNAVTRENWEEALSLKVKAAQSRFVPEPAVSLPKFILNQTETMSNTFHLPSIIMNN